MSLRVAVKKSDFVHVDNTVHIKNKIRKGRTTYTIGQVKCKNGAARHQKSSKIAERVRMTVERED